MLMTGTKKKTLKYICYIHYLVEFKKNMDEIWALIDLGSEINVMAPAYVKNLDLQMQKTNVEPRRLINQLCGPMA